MGIWDALSNIQFTDNAPANGGITPYKDLGALSKFGLTLQNIADPQTLNNYQFSVNASQNQQAKLEAQQRELSNQSALQQLVSDPNFNALSPAEQLRQTAAITGDPSALASFNASQVITPYQQQQLGLQQQQINAASQDRNKLQFIQGKDGVVYSADPRTGALSALTKPTTPEFKLPDGVNLPAGTIPVPDATAPGGFRVEPISGAPVGGMTPTVDSEKGRKLGSAILSDLDKIEGLAFDKDGGLNQSVVGQGYVGQGRSFDQGIRRAVQNTLYLKSGATAGESEINSTLQNYAPSPLDSPEQARAKLQGLRQFAEDSIPSYAKSGSLSKVGQGSKIIKYDAKGNRI